MQAQRPDHDSVLLLKSRDERGVAILYERHASKLYGLIRQIIHEEQQANIVLQDSFLKIWSRIDQYKEEKGRFLTWIYNIARNTALDLIRSKQYRHQQVVDSILQHHERLLSNANEQKINTIGLKDVVYGLEPKYKLVIDLIYFGGYTHAEIAKEMKIPLGTVKSRVKKALEILRQKLNVDVEYR